MGCARSHAQSRAEATQAAWWGQGPGGKRVTTFGHNGHPGGVCNQTECIWPIRPLHKAAQVSATRYEPGKLAPSNEHRVGGKQWDSPSSSATGSCDELSWVLSCPVLYWYIRKTTLYFYGFMRILWCKGSCLKLKITRSRKPGSAILEQAQRIRVQEPHGIWSSPNWTLNLNAKWTIKILLLVDMQLLVTKWVPENRIWGESSPQMSDDSVLLLMGWSAAGSGFLVPLPALELGWHPKHRILSAVSYGSKLHP